MKVDIQTILNVCFAICITAFIYQNNSLKDDVETLKGYAQLDTDKAWERMDSIEDKIRINYANFEKQDLYNKELQKVIAENATNIDIAFDNFDIAKQNSDIADSKIEANSSTIEYIQNYLANNFGNN